ncbi:hypothetical protein WN943_021704 [Citrus x changshan-huyou]
MEKKTGIESCLVVLLKFARAGNLFPSTLFCCVWLMRWLENRLYNSMATINASFVNIRDVRAFIHDVCMHRGFAQGSGEEKAVKLKLMSSPRREAQNENGNGNNNNSSCSLEF